MNKLANIIKKLNLIELTQEGGYFCRAFEAQQLTNTNRESYSCIYYLITKDEYSHMHVLDSDEIWFYHCGPAIEMLFIFPDNHSEIKILGPDIEAGQQLQILCPKNTIQGCHMLQQGEYSLVSCVNIPGYLQENFKLCEYQQLKDMISDEKHRPLLKALTKNND